MALQAACISALDVYSSIPCTIINSHQETVSGQACNPPDISLFPLVEEFYGTRYQSGSFSLIIVGSDFHCLRSFLSFHPTDCPVYSPCLQGTS